MTVHTVTLPLVEDPASLMAKKGEGRVGKEVGP